MTALHARTKFFSNPLNKSIYISRYHSMYPEDAVFGARPPNDMYLWAETSLANPEYDEKCMLKAVQHAVRSVHAQNHESTATVLILPEWIDASYKKAHLLISTTHYMQKMCELHADLTKFPSQDKDTQTAPNKDPGTNWPVGVYLVASASYLIAIVNAA
eukprot:jgi/Tetstr1/432453/TSEL_021829.t1